MVAGAAIVLLVLEACRRTVGWILPAVCVGFFLYAYYGGYLPFDWVMGTAATASTGSSSRS